MLTQNQVSYTAIEYLTAMSKYYRIWINMHPIQRTSNTSKSEYNEAISIGLCYFIENAIDNHIIF